MDKGNSSSQQQKDDLSSKKHESELTMTELEGLSPTLLDELNKFIAKQDTLKNENHFDAKIIVVHFSKKDNDCYVSIGTSHFYNSQNLEGFLIIGDKMIAFYNPQSECNKGLVNVSKLKAGMPNDFPDENSDIAIHTTYDPWGKKYKIHSQDSLELLYSGSF